MKKVVTVFGATGQQGGSVVRALLERSDSFHIRAVTRNPTSPRSLALRAAGCEVVQADLAQSESLIPILHGADCCFLNTLPPDRVAPDAAKVEFQYGVNVANACMAVGLQHVVFTTAPYCEKLTGAPVSWCDGKAMITEYIKEKGIPMTAINLPEYYDNYFSYIKPQKVQDGIFNFEIPTGDEAYGLIHIAYLGEAVRHIVTHRDTYLNKDITLVTDRLTVREIADIMNKHLKPLGKTIGNSKLSVDEAREKYKDVPGNEDVMNWYEFVLAGHPQYDGYKDTELGRRLMPSAKKFDKWVEENKEALAAALQ